MEQDMNIADIHAIARQAGFTREDHHAIDTMLVYFAHLIRAEVLEEAAGVCDEQAHNWHLHAKGGPVAVYNTCAAAIRALKERLG